MKRLSGWESVKTTVRSSCPLAQLARLERPTELVAV